MNNLKTIGGCMLQLLKSREDCDATFLVGPNKTPIESHQFVLKARSAVFKAMFSQNWEGGKGGTPTVVDIPDFEPQPFTKFLEYIYGDLFWGENVSVVVGMLCLAHKYLVDTLVTKCVSHLKKIIVWQNAIEIFQVARLYSHEDLMESAGSCLAKNFARLQNTEHLRFLDQETLKYLLKSESIAYSELTVFNTVYAWAEGKAKRDMNKEMTIRTVIQDIIPLIRFPTMTAKEFADTVVPKKVLDSDVTINLFVYLSSDKHERKMLARSLPFSVVHRKGWTNERKNVGRGERMLRTGESYCRVSRLTPLVPDLNHDHDHHRHEDDWDSE